MKETAVEREFIRQVKLLGGWAIKLIPAVRGIPDRMAILPGGRIIFVELKQPKGTVEVHQTVVHRRLANLGSPVAVLWTKEAVIAWAEGYVSEDS